MDERLVALPLTERLQRAFNVLIDLLDRFRFPHKRSEDGEYGLLTMSQPWRIVRVSVYAEGDGGQPLVLRSTVAVGAIPGVWRGAGGGVLNNT